MALRPGWEGGAGRPRPPGPGKSSRGPIRWPPRPLARWQAGTQGGQELSTGWGPGRVSLSFHAGRGQTLEAAWRFSRQNGPRREARSTGQREPEAPPPRLGNEAKGLPKPEGTSLLPTERGANSRAPSPRSWRCLGLCPHCQEAALLWVPPVSALLRCPRCPRRLQAGLFALQAQGWGAFLQTRPRVPFLPLPGVQRERKTDFSTLFLEAQRDPFLICPVAILFILNSTFVPVGSFHFQRGN